MVKDRQIRCAVNNTGPSSLMSKITIFEFDRMIKLAETNIGMAELLEKTYMYYLLSRPDNEKVNVVELLDLLRQRAKENQKCQ